MALDYVPNGRRKIRAGRPDGIGLPTKGNRNSTYLGRTITPGILASVGNPANPADPRFFRPAEKSAATKRREAIERRERVCPGCGIVAPVIGKCQQCW